MNTIKRTLQVVAMLLASMQLANAQAILPTSFNFDDATPTGWSESLNAGNARYASGYIGQACRLDGTTDYVLVEFAEEPGELTYWMKGQNTGGDWQGTFTVEESVNGSTFTPLHAFVDTDLPTGAFTEFTDEPASDTRYIRFYFTNKVSGHNVALDEVLLIQPTASPAQEINVTVDGNNIPNGFSASIGNTVDNSIVVQNLGTVNSLNIADITLSGDDAAQFSLGAWTSEVVADSEMEVALTFTPVGDGSRFCTITITSDDASEPEYVVYIYAIAGDFATEPTAQASDLWFPALNEWNYRVNFDPAAPAAENYIVLRKKGSAVTEVPIDGDAYLQGQWIGNSQVIYAGAAGEFDARNIETSTTYHFAVFSYNGPEGFENYLTGSPLTGTVTTDDPEIGTYYNGVDNTSAAFVTQLTTVLNPADYFQTYYSNYTSTLINEFYVRDTVVDGLSQNFVACEYSGVPQIYASGFQWWNGNSTEILSREHTFPQSWMPSYLDGDFEDSFEYSDLHNLMPVQQEACNAIRSNYPYGEVITPSYTYLETQFGENADGQECYEPRESIKGQAARNLMYHSVKNNTATDDFSFPENISFLVPYGQLEYVIKQWHFDHLPNNYERARNEYIFDEQHNRNPFVDSITYPCYIRFGTLTKWTPIVTSANNVLTCVDQALNYQWYMNGEEILGANSATYNITESGNYSVEVQQFAQCPAISSPEVIIGVEEMTNTQVNFSVYPNPSQGAASVSINSNTSASVIVNVLDATGKMISTSKVNVVPGKNTLPLDVVLSAGIYMVELQTNAGMLSQKLIVE